MMKMRMANPPASTASGTASQKEIRETKYIKTHSAAYGTSVLSSWRMPAQAAGVSYLATIWRHARWLRLAVESGRTVGAQAALGRKSPTDAVDWFITIWLAVH